MKACNANISNLLPCAVLIGSLLLPTLPAIAEPAPLPVPQDNQSEKLKKIEAEMQAAADAKAAQEEKARMAASAALAISRQLVSLSNTMRDTEEKVLATENRIGELAAEEAEKTQYLKEHREELVGLIAALERLSRRPAALSLIQPGKAKDTARAASVLGTMVPQISAKADTLKKELSVLKRVQTQLATERTALAALLADLATDQERQKQLLAERRREQSVASRQAQQNAQRLEALGQEAKSLQALLEKLEERAKRLREAPLPTARPARPPGKEVMITEMRGKLPLPASGEIIAKFGSQEKVGTSKGIRIKGRDGGQVVATHDGEVVYAGTFRHYGQLLIIEHPGGYHSLIAGMTDIFANVGQWVLSGEPVGNLSAQNGNTEVYVELRRRGQAIDPMPWFRK
ncbi:membrane protein [Kordiimonas sediminis]|uniref:Membrane protein n=1 Tax=Kordiimonas sediminis TaxID=1735581 RepID=A0A919ART9_9PROT|nr:peptidoglycan DD-metalloendopeptidase family protein [Kordiimonas sediminis]GHF20413.1 membrane protein [Kordiimonas sediminis]